MDTYLQMKQRLLKLQARLESMNDDGSETESGTEEVDCDLQEEEIISIEAELDKLVSDELDYYIDIEIREIDDEIAVGNDNYSTFFLDFEKIMRRDIKEKKDEIGFIDIEAELDRMYPNGDDDYFSED